MSSRGGNKDESVQALMGRLFVVSSVAVLICLCAQSEAAEEVDPPPNIARLAKELPSARWEYARPRVQYLLRKHEVKEEDLLAFVQNMGKDQRYSRQQETWLWSIVLLTGNRRSMEAFVDRVLGASDSSRWHVLTAAATYAGSEELSRVLCEKVESVNKTPERRARAGTVGWAVETISKHPVPEAIPLLRSYVIDGKEGKMRCDAAMALGRLESPEALKALEEAWVEARGDHIPDFFLLRSLATAIAEYGDQGLKAFARIAAGEKSHGYICYGLQLAGTPAAVRLAERLCDTTDVKSRAYLLGVKVAAGEPYRTAALLDALEKDDSSSIRMSVIGLCRDIEHPPAELKAAICRMALGHTDWLAYRAIGCLSSWAHREQREGKEVTWAEPVNGLALGLEASTYRTTDQEATLTCHVQVKNVLTEALLLESGDNCWILTVPGSPVFAAKAESGGGGLWPISPGGIRRLALRFPLAGAPFRELEPLTARLLFQVDDRNYEELGQFEGVGLQQWTGKLRTPEFAASFELPLANEDLDHWRQMLAEGRDKGRLPEGASIAWRGSLTWRMRYTIRFPTRPDRLAVRSGMLEGNNICYALPEDLLSLEPGEVKRLCRLLLEDDLFANMVRPWPSRRGRSGYPYRAEFRLTSGTRRGVWSGRWSTFAATGALRAFQRELLGPRIEEARRRLGIPVDPTNSPK